MNPVALIERVRDAEFRVELTDTGPQLTQTTDVAVMPGELLRALKAHRASVLAYIECRDVDD